MSAGSRRRLEAYRTALALAITRKFGAKNVGVFDQYADMGSEFSSFPRFEDC
jgi:hypothetical protein